MPTFLALNFSMHFKTTRRVSVAGTGISITGMSPCILFNIYAQRPLVMITSASIFFEPMFSLVIITSSME